MSAALFYKTLIFIIELKRHRSTILTTIFRSLLLRLRTSLNSNYIELHDATSKLAAQQG